MAQKDFLSARIEDSALKASQAGCVIYSDFFEPNLQHIIEREIGRYPQSDCEFFGGHDYAERKMLCVFPKGESISPLDYPIDLVKIKAKNAQISHPDVLGSVLALGIEREKVGDINITNDTIQLFVSTPMGEFIQNNLSKINKYDVSVECLPLGEAIAVEPNFTNMSVIIPSMRLDAIIHTVFRMSRNEASAFVKGEKVFINHVPTTKPSVNLKPGDIISVRSKGRFIVDEITGNTKKGNIKLSVKKFS